MKYRVSRCADSPKKRALKGCSTWTYVIADNIAVALQIKKEWKEMGYYVKVDEVQDNE